MRITEANCEYVHCYEWSCSPNTCSISVNLELWSVKPRVIEIPKSIRKDGKSYKVEEVSIWRGYYGEKHQVIVKIPNSVRNYTIYIDNYRTEFYD